MWGIGAEWWILYIIILVVTLGKAIFTILTQINTNIENDKVKRELRNISSHLNDLSEITG